MTTGSVELGFNVKAGPLSQISIQVLSLETAVQLAVGAYGWWKAKERSDSLSTLLSAAGGDLVSSASFNLETYRCARQNHHVIGTLVQQQELQVTACPQASTSVSDHAGMTCLRALTSALLCLYTVDATVHILAQIIPSHLIQMQHDDADITISGPLLSNLTASVTAIATEEDSNTFRAWLLYHAREEALLLQNTGGNKIPRALPQSSADAALAIAMLKWALTPTYRRKLKAYVTKSLTIWVLAVLLKAVGYEVAAAPNLLVTEEETEAWAEQQADIQGGLDVMLTISRYGRTDPYCSTYMPEVENCFVKAQLMPIRSIPCSIQTSSAPARRQRFGPPRRGVLTDASRAKSGQSANRFMLFSFAPSERLTWTMPLELPMLTLPDASAWSLWLATSALTSNGVWLTLAKVGVTDPTSLTYAQALDEALCHGWIDGQRRARDKQTYMQRFTLRTSKSTWSQRNVTHISRLEASGRMKAAGCAAVQAAKADGRWDAAYAGQATMESPPDLKMALAAVPAAQAAWDALKKGERFTICLRVLSLKNEARRQKRVNAEVERLAGVGMENIGKLGAVPARVVKLKSTRKSSRPVRSGRAGQCLPQAPAEPLGLP